MNTFAAGSQVKVYPRIANDPTPFVGRGQYLFTSSDGQYHAIRQEPFGQIRHFPTANFIVTVDRNLPAATIPTLASMPSTAPPLLGGAKKRLSRRSTKRRSTRKQTRGRRRRV
jgi:hypothetical protein